MGPGERMLLPDDLPFETCYPVALFCRQFRSFAGDKWFGLCKILFCGELKERNGLKIIALAAVWGIVQESAQSILAWSYSLGRTQPKVPPGAIQFTRHTIASLITIPKIELGLSAAHRGSLTHLL